MYQIFYLNETNGLLFVVGEEKDTTPQGYTLKGLISYYEEYKTTKQTEYHTYETAEKHAKELKEKTGFTFFVLKSI